MSNVIKLVRAEQAKTNAELLHGKDMPVLKGLEESVQFERLKGLLINHIAAMHNLVGVEVTEAIVQCELAKAKIRSL